MPVLVPGDESTGSFATFADVEARWRPLSDAEQAVATALIADAEDIILTRWPDAGDRLASATLTRIVAGMVKRAMLNAAADGVSAFSQSAGTFSQSATYANPTGNLYLTADDIRTLDGEAAGPKVRMGWLA